jgi:multiple antibiotic resistance protein
MNFLQFLLSDTFSIAEIDFKQILAVSLILFSVIDILGVIPVIIDIRQKAGELHSGKATIVSGILMIVFLFFGEIILNFLGLTISSFSLAGSIIIFLIGMEMLLGIQLFRDSIDPKSSSIVPLAFPLIAGAGTITTIISLRSQYEQVNVLIGIFLNLIFVYLVLRSSVWIEKVLGTTGANILRKVFSVILLAIGIKMFQDSLRKWLCDAFKVGCF